MKKVSITKAVRIKNQRVKPFDGDRRYLATGGLVHNKIETDIVTFETKPSRADLLVTEHQLIVARMAETNKVLLIDKNTQDLIVSTGFLVLDVQAGWDRDFLYHYFVSDFFQKQKNRLSIGATQKAINNERFKEILIPELSLEDQQRIGKILNRSDILRQKRKQAVELLDDYLKSVFLEMFGDPVTNPKKIRKAKIREMGTVFTGNTPPREILDNYGSFVEWVKSDNINNNSHYLTKATEFLSEIGSQKARIVPSGSVLVTCIAGSLSCIGNAGMADRTVAFNQQINAIVPNSETEQIFLYAQILYNKELFQNASTNSMKGMLNKSKFSEIELLKPDTLLQRKYSSLFSRTESIKQKMIAQSKKLEDQFQVLMQKAFKGEL